VTTSTGTAEKTTTKKTKVVADAGVVKAVSPKGVPLAEVLGSKIWIKTSSPI
jgi:hypothetical protein